MKSFYWLEITRFYGDVEVAQEGMTRHLASTLRSVLLPLPTAIYRLALRRDDAAAIVS
jgi:hypothetical protein